MTTKHLARTLARKAILLVDKTYGPVLYNRRFEAIANGRRLEVLTQGDDVSTMRVVMVGDSDEPQIDYFAGRWVNTMPEALREMGGE